MVLSNNRSCDRIRLERANSTYTATAVLQERDCPPVWVAEHAMVILRAKSSNDQRKWYRSADHEVGVQAKMPADLPKGGLLLFETVRYHFIFVERVPK